MNSCCSRIFKSFVHKSRNGRDEVFLTNINTHKKIVGIKRSCKDYKDLPVQEGKICLVEKREEEICSREESHTKRENSNE